jgi:hypothetical protein
MRNNRAVRMLKIALIASLAIVVFGFAVAQLWNWLMPALFGLHMITFWQALGLLILTRILVGGFRGGRGPGMHWRRRMFERWEQMTPEQRDKFRQGMRSRCGNFETNEATVPQQ